MDCSPASHWSGAISLAVWPQPTEENEEIPTCGLCFARRAPTVVFLGKTKLCPKPLGEFCFVAKKGRQWVAEKLSLDFLFLFYQEKRKYANAY